MLHTITVISRDGKTTKHESKAGHPFSVEGGALILHQIIVDDGELETNYKAVIVPLDMVREVRIE